jgi:peptidoglycan/xylan/chitin deacetylase (PgdA/CDA1 family)
MITSTATLHLGAAAAVVLAPAAWPWAAGGVIASHLALTAAGLWPRSALLGPNWTRLPESAANQIAITIDDGPHPEVTPRVLDLLEPAAPAQFFAARTWRPATRDRGRAAHADRHQRGRADVFPRAGRAAQPVP